MVCPLAVRSICARPCLVVEASASGTRLAPGLGAPYLSQESVYGVHGARADGEAACREQLVLQHLLRVGEGGQIVSGCPCAPARSSDARLRRLRG